MQKKIVKLQYLFEHYGIFNYGESNDSIVIYTPYTDRFVNDCCIAIRIYKCDDEYRIDDMGFIQEIIDVCDIDISTPFFKKVFNKIIDSYELKQEDSCYYYVIPDIDDEYQKNTDTEKSESIIIKRIFEMFGAIATIGRLNEVMEAYEETV